MKWRVFSSIPTTYQSAGIKHIGIKKKTKDSAVMDGINVLVTGLDSVHPTMTKKVIHSIKKSADLISQFFRVTSSKAKSIQIQFMNFSFGGEEPP